MWPTGGAGPLAQVCQGETTSAHFQHFLAEMKKSFSGDLYGRTGVVAVFRAAVGAGRLTEIGHVTCSENRTSSLANNIHQFGSWANLA
jgi:hypothetical protein